MAVPDWPNTYGYNMFFFPISQWVGGIFYEHTHRLLASAVGLITGVLALWLYGKRARRLMRWLGVALTCLGAGIAVAMSTRWADALVIGGTGVVLGLGGLFWPNCDPSPKWLRRLGLAAFVAVVVQGVLGGLRVTAMKDELGIFHGTLAQLFFTLLCSIALFTSRRFSQWWNTARSSRGGPLTRMFAVTTFLVLAQLILGASMRHQHAGLAIPDFPTAHGKFWPATDPDSVQRYNQQRIEIVALKPITAGQIHLQMTHRIMALVILISVTACLVQTIRSGDCGRSLRPLAWGWLLLILIQAALGAFTIWSNKAADIATAHVVFGALSLAAGSIVSIVSIRLPVQRGVAAPSPQTTEQDCGRLGSHPAPATGL